MKVGRIMSRKKMTIYGGIIAAVLIATLAAPAMACGKCAVSFCAAATSPAIVNDNVTYNDLQARLNAAEEKIASLEDSREPTWIETRRSEETKAMVQEIMADADARTMMLADQNPITVNVGGFVQTRYIYNGGGGVEANHGFSVPAARLILSGKVYDVGYKVSGQWNDGGDFVLKDAYGTFDMMGMDFQFGQFKSPFMKEVLVSRVDTLAADRSIVAYTYGQGRSQGIQLGKDFGGLNVRAAYTDGFNSANGAGVPNGYALTGRVDWDVTDWWNLGAAISWNDLDVTDYWTYTFDTGLKFGALDVTAAFVGVNQDAGDNWATTFSAAYQCMDNLQGYVQYEYGTTEAAGNDLSVITVGANYWLNDNVKWTTDFGYAFDGIGAGWNVADTGWNNSVDSGEYLVRTQIQLQF